MSTFKVSKEKIEVFPHYNAEKLSLAKIGSFQCVTQKGLYNGGESVVFAPEKSILTGLLEQEYKNYLTGPDKNRVKAVTLRGELSCGIIIPDELVFKITGKHIDELSENEDLSQTLGISQYIPKVPSDMSGEIEAITEYEFKTNHDVEQFGVYASEFVEGERVVATEKLHGSQFVGYCKLDASGKVAAKWVSSKGQSSKGFSIIENESNFYWKSAKNIDLWNLISKSYTNPYQEKTIVQIFGEAIPCQGKDWSYGQTEPTLRIFKVVVNGNTIPYSMVVTPLKDYWVPILYDGLYTDIPKIRELAKGNECVSGKSLHIKEGLVLTPFEDRRAKDGTRLLVKMINPAYKETGEELN